MLEPWTRAAERDQATDAQEKRKQGEALVAGAKNRAEDQASGRLRTVCAGCSPKPGAQATGAEGTLAATPAIVIGAAGTDQQEHSASEAGRRRQRWDVGAAVGEQQRTVARGA